jgi:hypothetical protein
VPITTDRISPHRVDEAEESSRLFLRPVLLFHLATRLLTTIALLLGAHRARRPFSAVVTAWDGKWYGQIVSSGYPDVLPTRDGSVVTNPAGFFPLFPLVLRPFTAVGIPYWLASQVCVLLFSTCAALLIALVCRRYVALRAAVLTACAWSAFPTASVLSVAYSEALFTLLAAAGLMFLLRRQWVLAGVLAALAGAVRPTGVVVVAAVGVAVLQAVLVRREWRSLLAAVIAPIGTLAALAFIGLSTDRLDAWSVTESQGWRVRFDGGATFLHWAYTTLSSGHSALKVAFVLAVLAAVVLVVLAVIGRPPLPVLTFLVLGAFLALGQGGEFFTSPLRFLLPIFPLLVPLGSWLSSRPRLVSSTILGVLALVSALVGVYYFTVSTGAP